MNDKTFQVGNVTLEYNRSVAADLDPMTSQAIDNERTIEVPLGQYFIDQTQDKSNLIEIGATLPHYREEKHQVVDLDEKHPLAVNRDAYDMNFTGRDVVSISTIEHVHFDPTDQGTAIKIGHSAELAWRIAKQAKRYLLTWPINYNLQLDAFMSLTDPKGFFVMERMLPERKYGINLWRQCKVENPVNYIYKMQWLERLRIGVMVVTNLPELLG